jgi:hypothetical protein
VGILTNQNLKIYEKEKIKKNFLRMRKIWAFDFKAWKFKK